MTIERLILGLTYQGLALFGLPAAVALVFLGSVVGSTPRSDSRRSP